MIQKTYITYKAINKIIKFNAYFKDKKHKIYHTLYIFKKKN